MQNNTEAGSPGVAVWTEERAWRLIPLMVLGLSLVSVVVLIWVRTINEQERTNYALSRVFMELRTRVTAFHLWLEEDIQGDSFVVLEDVWGKLQTAINLADVLLHGGKVEHDLKIEPVGDRDQRAYAVEIMSSLMELKELGLRRKSSLEEAGIGSPLDEQFDGAFRRFEDLTESLEHAVQVSQLSEQTAGRRLYLTIVIIWSLVVTMATIGLWNREVRRKRAEVALQEAIEQLCSQDEELSRHRGRLVELVKERTGELTAANKELQREVVARTRVAAALEENKNTLERLSLGFRTLLDAIPDSLILVSPRSKVLWANKSAISALGDDTRDVTGWDCRRLSENRFDCKDQCPVARAFRTARTESVQKSGPGGTAWDIRAFPVKDVNGRVLNVIEVAADITEKLTIQAEALRVAHLASLGELAAGVAHEINNPINGIINYAQVLIDGWRGPEEDVEVPLHIIKEGERIANIVGSLLSFARENRGEKVLIQVQEILSETLSLVGRQLESEGIILSVDMPENLPLIAANLHLMQQVYLNIVSNARQALNQKYPGSDAGKLLEIEARQASGGGRPSVTVTFRDHGVGIPAAIIHKVQEPFFTTKPEGLGTGLGLSISHGIVSDHGGRLILNSEESKYTEVKILLPAEVGNES